MQKKTLSCILLIFLTLVSTAQDFSKIKFGEITAKDFSTTVYSVDSNAQAFVIADIGSSDIQGNLKGWFSLYYKHYRRIHILNKGGYDLADVTIRLYADKDEEEVLDKLKAVTYNLENGKVTATKLDIKSGVFRENLDKNWTARKFTLPNVKEGSIIEYEYVIKSDFLQNLQPWEFQGAYPRLWSEYKLSLPEFLGYVFLTQGFKTYDIQNRKDRYESFNIMDTRSSGASEQYNFSATVTDFHWVMKNVPALKEESFTSALSNHTSKIEFQLSELRKPLVETKVIESWPKVVESMLESENFGKHLKSKNDWLLDALAAETAGVKDKEELARRMFYYVRNHYTCTNHSRYTIDQNLKSIQKTRKGSVAEINLLLTAMLQAAGVPADPVILSTRLHGKTYSLYPLMSQYNYVVCRINISGKDLYLDASEPSLGFGKLPLRCFNGAARVINKAAEAIDLNADHLKEIKHSSVFIVNDEQGKLAGNVTQTPGYYESFSIRQKVEESGKEKLLKEVQEQYGADAVISNFNIDSAARWEQPVVIRYELELKGDKEDIIYLNPMMGEGYKDNPFKSARRLYPVEMPYAMDETYVLYLEVPAGYVADELPKSMILKLNEQDDAMFEYRISQSDNVISLRCRIQFKRAHFMPDEYETLREFFNLIVNKQSEQVVFKKKG